MRRPIRILALLLAVMLPWTALAESATPSDVQTPVVTQEAAQPETPATETPTEESTAVPEPETPTTTPESEQATEEPTVTPDAEETTETPTEEPTVTPEAEDTAEPSETPEEEATASPEPEDTEEPWDEEQCDHANLNCVQAPACDDPNCQHLTVDVHGLDVPLCAKGRWVLDREDEILRQSSNSGARMFRAAARPVTIDLDQGDATIYRSGSYIIKGSARTNATLTIAGERLVVLDVRNAVLDTLNAGNQCGLTVQTTGQNAIRELKLGQDSEIKFTSGGALQIETVTRRDNTKVTVTGGSVKADTTEANGRSMLVCAAQGITAVTVEGDAYPADQADDDGCFYLWLKNPGDGMTWKANVADTTLTVTREAVDQGSTVVDLPSGQVTEITAAGVYRLKGALDAATQVKVMTTGVRLVLDNVTVQANNTLLTSDEAVTVTVQGTNAVYGVFVSGSGSVNINGSGTLTVDQMLTGYTAVTAPVTLAEQKLTVNGAAATLLKTTDSKLLLPALEEGKRWQITGDESTLTAVSETVDGDHFDLTQTPQVTTAAAKFTVDGGTEMVAGAIASTASNATATLRNVHLTGGNVLQAAGSLSVELTGSNDLLGTNAIQLAEGASVQLNVVSGRTVLEQTDLTGITLVGNVKVVPESSQPHTTIQVTDGDNNLVAGKNLTLTINGITYQFTTHDDGCIYLWGQGAMNVTDLAATDGETVYTAVIVNGDGKATERIAIENVTVTDVEDDSIRVNFTADAATTGVMYVVGDAVSELPDTYVESANYILADNGQATILGVKPGQVVTLRIVAAAEENALFMADTVDGFSFSEIFTIKHRGAFTTDEELDQTYTGKAYKNPVKLPKGAKIAYQGKQLKDGMPVKVGSYTMKITIPEGNDTYLPGVYEFDFKITKIPLTIIPDPNQEKLEGEDDPEIFTFETDGLINKDTVEGILTREEGEEPGNYAFLLDELIAPDYYELKLADDAYTFTIVPGGDFPSGGGGEILRPIKQTVVRGDKREVSVMLNTQDTLTVTHSVFGRIVFATTDKQERPFTPSLSWNKETDEVLLRIRTEAELNKDGGYVTDSNGKALWTGRYMSMGLAGLNQLNKVGVDAISLNCNGASLVVRIEDLIGDTMQAYAKEQGGMLQKGYYRLTIVPVETPDDAQEAEAFDALSPLTRGWRISVTLTLDGKETDVTSLLPSLRATVDMQETKELLKRMGSYQEETFTTDMALYSITKQEDAYAPAVVESTYITPFMPEELTQMDFPAVMYAHEYLAAPISEPALLTISWAEKTE